MGESTRTGPSCPCTPTPGGPQTCHFGTPRTHQSTAWEKAAIMSSLVSCRERTRSWQQGPPGSSPFSLSPTWIWAPLGALFAAQTPSQCPFSTRGGRSSVQSWASPGEAFRGRLSGEGTTLHPRSLLPLALPPTAGAGAGMTHGEVREQGSVQRGQPAAHGQRMARARPQPPQPWWAQDPQRPPPAPPGTRAGAAGHSPSITATPRSCRGCPNSPSSSALASSRSSPQSPVSRLRRERGHRPLPLGDRPGCLGTDPAAWGQRGTHQALRQRFHRDSRWWMKGGRALGSRRP